MGIDHAFNYNKIFDICLCFVIEACRLAVNVGAAALGGGY